MIAGGVVPVLPGAHSHVLGLGAAVLQRPQRLRVALSLLSKGIPGDSTPEIKPHRLPEQSCLRGDYKQQAKRQVLSPPWQPPKPRTLLSRVPLRL